MAKSKKVSAAPSEDLVPKVFSLGLVVAMLILPFVGMVLAGMAMENSADEGARNLFALLLLILGVTFVICAPIALWGLISARRKLSAASRRMAESLHREHGISVLYPTKLIVPELSKPRLNPYQLAAVDPSGRPLILTLGTDVTGTKVVPTIHGKEPGEIPGSPSRR